MLILFGTDVLHRLVHQRMATSTSIPLGSSAPSATPIVTPAKDVHDFAGRHAHVEGLPRSRAPRRIDAVAVTSSAALIVLVSVRFRYATAGLMFVALFGTSSIVSIASLSVADGDSAPAHRSSAFIRLSNGLNSLDRAVQLHIRNACGLSDRRRRKPRGSTAWSRGSKDSTCCHDFRPRKLTASPAAVPPRKKPSLSSVPQQTHKVS